jgi:hypothetical protein
VPWRRRAEEHTEIFEGRPRSGYWPSWRALSLAAGLLVVAGVLLFALWPGDRTKTATGADPESPSAITAGRTSHAARASTSRTVPAVPGSQTATRPESTAPGKTGTAGHDAAEPPSDRPADRRARSGDHRARPHHRRARSGDHRARPGHHRAASRSASRSAPRTRRRARATGPSARKRAARLRREARGHIAGARWDAARRTLLELAEIRGQRAATLTGLARLAFERGRPAEAARVARRAVRAGGGNPARMILANSQLKLGRYQAAAATYRRVLRHRPGHGVAKRNLAIAERRLGR